MNDLYVLEKDINSGILLIILTSRLANYDI